MHVGYFTAINRGAETWFSFDIDHQLSHPSDGYCISPMAPPCEEPMHHYFFCSHVLDVILEYRK